MYKDANKTKTNIKKVNPNSKVVLELEAQLRKQKTIIFTTISIYSTKYEPELISIILFPMP